MLLRGEGAFEGLELADVARCVSQLREADLSDECSQDVGASWTLRFIADAVVCLTLWLCSPHALADAAPERFLTQERLTGAWWGTRTQLEERGLGLEAFYTLELLGNASGGAKRGVNLLGNLDLALTAELETLIGWTGARLFLYGLGNHGGSPSQDVGDIQGVSSIEAFDTWKLFEGWLEQDFQGGRASLRVGLYDVNSEFDVIPAASLFVHSSPGTGAAFGLSGRNGPSIFPTTSLAARFNVRPTEELYVRVTAADGVPGDPDDPEGTRVRFENGDGAFIAAEVGVYNLPPVEPRGRTRRQGGQVPPAERRYGLFGKYALGVWGYTGDFDDFVRVDAAGRPRQRTGSFGVYAFAEQAVYFEPEDAFQGLSVFVRLGIADRKTNAVDGYVGGGVVYRGLLPRRPLDRIGFSVAAAHLGGDFRKGRRRAGGSTKPWEIALELTYGLRLAPWLSIQPDLQYVIDPGGDAALDDAVVVGGRLVVAL